MILLRKLIGFYRKQGAAATLRVLLRIARSGSVHAPLSVMETLGFTVDKPRFETPEAPVVGLRYSPKRANFVIPSFGKQSGGHTTLFRLARLLEQAGLDVEFYIMGNSEYLSEAEAARTVRDHYFPLRAAFRLGIERMRPADFVFATEWRTAYPVRDFPHARHKAYVVQDFEPAFFAASSQAQLAENTYRFGFDCVTAGRWLKGLMEGYGARATHFDLAYDGQYYVPRDSIDVLPRKRVAFYARHVTPRRAFELGSLALELVRRKHPDLEIVLYGWDEFGDRVPFDYVNAGLLDHEELAELYRGCRAGLSLSLTNYSLVPQEMLACGLPVVEADLPSLRAAYPGGTGQGGGISLAEPSPEGIAAALDHILSEPASSHRARRQAARSLVEGLTWENSMQEVVKWFAEN